MKGLLMGVIACWLAITPLLGSFAFANSVDDKRAELNDLQIQMQEMEARRAKARREAEAASDNLNATVYRLHQVQRDVNHLEGRKEWLEYLIQENTTKLAEAKKQKDERMAAFRQRLRDIYIAGQVNYLDVLLGASDFRDFASRMYLLKKVLTQDSTLINEVTTASEKMVKRQKMLDECMSDVRINERDLSARKHDLNEVREERAQILYKKNEEKQQAEYEYERLLELSESVANMIRQMESNGMIGSAPPAQAPPQVSKYRFIWPCRGEITSYYGWRTHPIFGTTKYHSGMDIAVDYGTPIKAAAAGTIIYSGWLGGYGYTIMIDHGGGLVTLYAHNNELAVYEGQYVNQGVVVAYAGSTGWSTGPHCHFEARLHGEVTEPLDYLPPE
ncbi:MAG: peptidoglycan DD-metalloendopeptidase family protein [Phascolarctobacterium sp.]|nr:peptidoglycan DD-metalloendopeptidase family protein [Phascolarctobacterium sp.]